ncbi:MAG: YraN family protein [Desulfovibrio sp.]|jgi:putative endonuclease|nr:YraN family protein [Desulfovibrio sp.]
MSTVVRGEYKGAPHLNLGKAGEEAAAALLVRKGFRILDRNWRPAGARRGLELDMVADLKGTLVFVEVKTRRAAGGENGAEGIPVYAGFTPVKRKRFAEAARCWLSEHAAWNRPCRFDLILVERRADGTLNAEQHADVIELGTAVGGGNPYWQPW